MNVNQTSKPASNLYNQVVNSKPAQFAKANPVLAGAGTIGAGVIFAEAYKRSDLVVKATDKALIPAVAAGAAVFGASMVKDAFQNDLPKAGTLKAGQTQAEKDELGSANVRLGAKVLGGSILTVAGTEIAAQTLTGYSPTVETAKLLTKVLPGEGLAFAGMATGLGAMAYAGAKSMKEKGVTLGNAAAVGIGATGATTLYGQAVWTKFQFTPHSHAVIAMGDKATGLVGGASLGLGAYALGKHALKALDEGKTGQAALAAIGATTAGAAAIHVLGNTTGIESLSNLGQKVFAKNPLLAGSIAAVAMAGAGYYMFSQNEAKAEQK